MTKEPVKVLKEMAGHPRRLSDLIGVSADSIVSKIVVDKPAGSITLFAFDEGQRLSEHTSPYDAFVQVLDGQVTITIGGQEHTLSSGQGVIMPALIPHSVRAQKAFKMLLTMIRGEKSEPDKN